MVNFAYFQRLGKALMLPIATLPIAALLLRFGMPDMLDISFIAKAGSSIFDNLPLIFALGISVGLSKDGSGAAALAGVVGYFILTQATIAINPDVNLGFFAGILAGIISGHAYNYSYQAKMPDFLAFFAGKRLTPIVAGLCCLVMAWFCGEFWIFAQHGIDNFSAWIAQSGAIGQFIYGVMNRALIPLGLHYFLHSVFWFSLGECTKVSYEVGSSLHQICLNPEVVSHLTLGQALPNIDNSVITKIADMTTRGDLNRFFAGDPKAGVYMAWAYPVMMGGLPGAALALTLASPKSKRKLVGGMLLSLALTSFLTGITEPLEFSFLFIAPVLYVIHAVLAGVAMVVCNSLGILHGFGFSAGLIDFILNWGLATKPWLLVPIVGVFFVLYFVIFYFVIKIFKLPTPEVDEANDKSGSQLVTMDPKAYIEALGGTDNIVSVDACITRLRLGVNDCNLFDDDALKELGAKGIVRIGAKSAQVILGPKAESIANSIKASIGK
ncbi:N-acetylglucosamine-specific PTS transporter subunit IIBC [Photobacterium kishitanii]|uniref:N-acetylglucosamine-specific PTS transporter subunit IIBC n=1 Tax=Photobacterium kishitanii TaxID=318456 RepID=UPI0005D316A9|nr:N-acetylglucosamine-specific PTS transporter subunit IIBC [Photobacterium kishitanii]KJG10221.1 PTS N-acetyl-D-glucosamine transporter [Photobacterium kishitanii]OBU28165.1 PTS N-acetyl-D-glucosamine transporter [Photobacterium kishitanii]PSV06973.1 PTS N-acetyl-D-glucosamine transporter [Photobacterium kishitanii]PSV14468.1 PTS N-acetyl-D-glucosamine transporter [Photobacterium kishitanii]PSV78007.1 PTS N-acetyl-D-glucosamine transporter [Photobacterium kishitanii]